MAIAVKEPISRVYKSGLMRGLQKVEKPKKLSKAGEWAMANPNGLDIQVDWEAVYDYVNWAAKHK